MTLASRLFSKRGLTPQQIFSTGADWYRGDTAAGINVTAEQAMTSAVGKCVRLLADDIAQLPVDFYRRSRGRQDPIEAPDWYTYPTTRRWDTWPDHITEVVVSLLADGNAFIQGLPSAMNPEYLYVLDPDQTSVREVQGRVRIDYKQQPFYDADVAHLKWVRMPGALRGLNVIEASKESVGLELAAREWASSFFANGATLSLAIKHPGVPTKEAVDNLRDQFAMRHTGRRKSHAFGILTGGADIMPLSITPQQAELNPLWQHVLEEAASIFHIPPHMLASQTPSGQSYASVEQKSIEYVQHAVVPIVRRLEAAYSRFIPGDDTFVKFNVNALLRGDAWSRAQVHAAYLQNKVITRDEVRRLEDLPPADEAVGLDTDNGGFLETPNNNNGGESPAAQAAPDKGDAAPERSLDIHVTTPDVRVDTPDVTINMPQIELQPVPDIRVDSLHVSDSAVAQIGGELRAELVERLEVNHVEAVEKTQRVAASVGEFRSEVEARLDAERDEVNAAIAAVAEDVKRLRDIPAKRVTVTQRDEHNRPLMMLEKIGNRTVRKVITRDANGQIESVTEVTDAA